MKMDILTVMCPPSVQDFFYKQGGALKGFKSMGERVRNLVEIRMSSPGGVRVVNEVTGELQGGASVEEMGAARSSTQCHRCGGWGHVSPSFPTQKGKGKGKGGGKG